MIDNKAEYLCRPRSNLLQARMDAYLLHVAGLIMCESHDGHILFLVTVCSTSTWNCSVTCGGVASLKELCCYNTCNDGRANVNTIAGPQHFHGYSESLHALGYEIDPSFLTWISIWIYCDVVLKQICFNCMSKRLLRFLTYMGSSLVSI